MQSTFQLKTISFEIKLKTVLTETNQCETNLICFFILRRIDMDIES